ncbi:MAG: hypothetical protein ABFD98_15400 [Syntrophobacteraceae bacterium]|nr:MCP four helix bundle domain-containing protein [Desulfobacteraceae bacterium]
MNGSRGRIAAPLAVLLALAVVLAFVAFSFREGPDLKNVVGILVEKMNLLSAMRVNLLKSEEAEKSAVMADTDEASRDFADQSTRASDLVERDRRELELLLKQDHTDKEMQLSREFDTCWNEFREIDREILGFAVQNTNFKAAALSFGKGYESVERFARAVKSLIDSSVSSGRCSLIVKPATDALAAALSVQAMHAPHIVESDSSRMDDIEAEMRREGEIVEKSLGELADMVPEEERATLEEAKTAYAEFASVTAEVLRLSRENTNIKSFALSLGKKRKIAAHCDETLLSLQEAVRGREFRATR